MDPISGDILSLEIENVPQTYFNGFAVTLGTGDVLISLMRNGKPVQVVQCSYTVAKTLSLGLTEVVATLEEITGNKIMTTHFVDERIRTHRPNE